MKREYIHRIVDKNIAEEVAEAEKPLRDIARQTDLSITKSDKEQLDRVVIKIGDKKQREILHQNSEEKPIRESKKKKPRLAGEPLSIQQKESWNLILKITAKGHELLRMIHESGNRLFTKQIPESFFANNTKRRLRPANLHYLNSRLSEKGSFRIRINHIDNEPGKFTERADREYLEIITKEDSQ